jgi:putative zinc finger/helix-turn-helix YgiT family protein
MNDERPVCPICGKGHMILQVMDRSTTLSDGQIIVVPDVEVEVCDNCQESAISLESSLKMEAYVAEKIELIPAKELSVIRERLGVDQLEMSEILGLGTKTYHRWEKGNQIPSRSMGYYIRVLSEFPEAFNWLKNREWRSRSNIIEVDFKTAFPALGGRADDFNNSCEKPNFARALYRI